MSKDFKLTLVVLLAFVAGAIFGRHYVPRSASTAVERQRLNMAAAEEELAAVNAVLTDGRFKDVQAFVYTGQDGAIGLTGQVRTEADLFRLMKALAEKQLRVAIFWQVKVVDGK